MNKLDELIETFSKGVPTPEQWTEAMQLCTDPAQIAELAKSFDTNEPASAVTGGKAPTGEVTDQPEGNTGAVQGESTKFDNNEDPDAVTGGKAPKKDGVTDAPEGNTGAVTKSLVPEPGVLAQQFQSDPALAEVMDAVAPVQAMVNHQESLVKGVGSIADQVSAGFAQLQKSLDGLSQRISVLEAQPVQKSVQAAPPAPVAPQAPVAPANPLQGQMLKSLQTLQSALEATQRQVNTLENTVAQQPASPHPVVPISKSVGAEPPSRTQVISILQKGALDGKLDPSSCTKALRFIQQARDPHLLVPILRQECPQALPLLGVE